MLTVVLRHPFQIPGTAGHTAGVSAAERSEMETTYGPAAYAHTVGRNGISNTSGITAHVVHAGQGSLMQLSRSTYGQSAATVALDAVMKDRTSITSCHIVRLAARKRPTPRNGRVCVHGVIPCNSPRANSTYPCRATEVNLAMTRCAVFVEHGWRRSISDTLGPVSAPSCSRVKLASNVGCDEERTMIWKVAIRWFKLPRLGEDGCRLPAEKLFPSRDYHCVAGSRSRLHLVAARFALYRRHCLDQPVPPPGRASDGHGVHSTSEASETELSTCGNRSAESG